MKILTPELGPEGNGPYRLLRGARAREIERLLVSLEDPAGTQAQRLAAIMAGGADTAFGREHGLARVRTLDDLRAAVPIRDYEGHRPYLERVAAGEQGVLTSERVTMLLETSGTTGRPKHLPVTPSWAATCASAQATWVLGLVRDHEAITKGSALTIVSPAEHARSPGGLPIGANTGRMHQAQPWWLRLRYPVPHHAFELKQSDLKLYTILRYALQAKISSITTANPSTILLLCRRLLEWAEPLAQDLRDGTLRRGPAEALSDAERRRFWWTLRRATPPTDWRPAKIWPLVVVNCWKGGPAPYFVDRLPEALGAEIPVREVGITASEGFFAVPLGDWDGGVLWTTGHVMEFVGDDGRPRGAHELEPGERVRLIITTEAGLYRYDLDDVLEVVGVCGRTPVVRFVGKGRRVLSAVNERVGEAQAAEAARRAAETSGLRPAGFTVAVSWAAVPRYRIGLEAPEAEATPARLQAFAARFDEALRVINVEYDTRRESGRLDPAQAEALSEGTFQRYRAARVAAGAPEGQVKDPILCLDDMEWSRVVGAPGERA